jgi:hypothetical protein
VGDGDVAEEGARVGVDDGQVGVVALKGRDEGERDGVRGVEGESGGRVEVLDGGLSFVSWTLGRLYENIPRDIETTTW